MSMSVRIRYFKTFFVSIFKNRQRLTDRPKALIHTTSIKIKSIPFWAGNGIVGAKWLFQEKGDTAKR